MLVHVLMPIKKKLGSCTESKKCGLVVVLAENSKKKCVALNISLNLGTFEKVKRAFSYPLDLTKAIFPLSYLAGPF